MTQEVPPYRNGRRQADEAAQVLQDELRKLIEASDSQHVAWRFHQKKPTIIKYHQYVYYIISVWIYIVAKNIPFSFYDYKNDLM